MRSIPALTNYEHVHTHWKKLSFITTNKTDSTTEACSHNHCWSGKAISIM